MTDQHVSPVCPKCNATLASTMKKGVPVAACSGCQGIWLSASALEVMLTRRDAIEAAGRVQQLDHVFQQPSPHPCVGCRQPLMTTWIAEVEVEYCPRCRGIFLDRGELKQVALRDEQGSRTAGALSDANEWGLGDIILGAVDLFD